MSKMCLPSTSIMPVWTLPFWCRNWPSPGQNPPRLRIRNQPATTAIRPRQENQATCFWMIKTQATMSWTATRAMRTTCWTMSRRPTLMSSMHTIHLRRAALHSNSTHWGASLTVRSKSIGLDCRINSCRKKTKPINSRRIIWFRMSNTYRRNLTLPKAWPMLTMPKTFYLNRWI